ncbi:Uncharacterised protein [Cutibacterium granulosum]|uniref:Uncharacterized protein n=1 Tax=Cutibacterium granulosum TaxID=33011 RepID=A0A239WU17_9ACTN|nr:Uncharacterised protein [Cutibacterium granulosum]
MSATTTGEPVVFTRVHVSDPLPRETRCTSSSGRDSRSAMARTCAACSRAAHACASAASSDRCASSRIRSASCLAARETLARHQATPPPTSDTAAHAALTAAATTPASVTHPIVPERNHQ